MQQELETRLETLLGKWLAGRASEAEAAELRSAASGNEELSQALELVQQSSDCLRQSAIGDASMIPPSLPPFTRPQELAETLEQLHTSRRRILILSIGTMIAIALVVALVSGPAALWAPNSIVSTALGGLALSALAIHLRQGDPLHQLRRLDSLEGGTSWLEKVESIGKFAFLSAIFASAIVWLRHREFSQLPSTDGCC
jgi:hypothetical protein